MNLPVYIYARIISKLEDMLSEKSRIIDYSMDVEINLEDKELFEGFCTYFNNSLTVQFEIDVYYYDHDFEIDIYSTNEDGKQFKFEVEPILI